MKERSFYIKIVVSGVFAQQGFVQRRQIHLALVVVLNVADYHAARDEVVAHVRVVGLVAYERLDLVELVYDGVEVPFIPTIYNNTVVCYSYSKSLSLPGERIGYVYVPSFAEDSEDVYYAVAGAARIMGHVCPPTLIQKVIARCADKRPDLRAYDENRRLLYENLCAMGYDCVKPEGAFYLFVKAPNGDAEAFSEKAKLE